VHFSYAGQTISPWHDIPLAAGAGLDGPLHFCCEIPKWTRRKFEVATKEADNPVKQDEKKGVLREYKWGGARPDAPLQRPALHSPSFPCADMMFNYGFFPQTWEDPEHVDADTGCRGDNDPLDVVEVGARQMKTGEVVAVKVLGVLGMIDDGETDWKVFAVRLDDPLAARMNDLADLERELPGAVGALREWLRVYKVPEGKPVNAFALEEAAQDAAYARRVVADTHAAWVKSHGAIRRDLKGRSGTGHGIMASPSMSELGLDDATPVPTMA
jgi:inorganic pyrophosphatase